MYNHRARSSRSLCAVPPQTSAGWEEYYDYLFPDDEQATGKGLKILEMAQKWKQDRKRKVEDIDET